MTPEAASRRALPTVEDDGIDQIFEPAEFEQAFWSSWDARSC